MAIRSLLTFGLGHLVFFGLVRPYQTWRTRDVWQTPPLPRTQFYRSNSAAFLTFGTLSLVTIMTLRGASSRAAEVTHIFVLGRLVERPRDVWFGLFPKEWPSLESVALGVVAYLVMVTIDLIYSRRCFERRRPHVYHSTPQTREEQVGWVTLSTLAGVTEELTWRGVQPELIAQLTGTLWPAVAICTVTFGVGHVRQGVAFAVIAGLFALTLHALTFVTGSLYVPMVVHIAINVTVGLRAGSWAARSS